MTEAERSDHLDGNVLAGPLSALFAQSSTLAAECVGCGHRGPIERAPVFGAPMGLIARCPTCAEVLLRYSETPAGRRLDLRGLATLHEIRRRR
jgi:hypothetical protein